MLVAGMRIGPYTLEREIGRGSFGSVWLAEHESLIKRQVAVKLPLPELVDLERLRDEAQTWARASFHPNVVTFLEANTYDGQVVLASEYVAGGSLQEWLHQERAKASVE